MKSKVRFYSQHYFHIARRLKKIVKTVVGRIDRFFRRKVYSYINPIYTSFGNEKIKLFDADYYVARYPDVKRAGADPFSHYTHFGWREGRNPSENFDTTFYLTKYPDVRAAEVNPLLHYVKWGYKEGRLPKPILNENYGRSSAIGSAEFRQARTTNTLDKAHVFSEKTPQQFQHLVPTASGVPDYFTMRARNLSTKNLIFAIVRDVSGWHDLDRKLSSNLFQEADVLVAVCGKSSIGKIASDCAQYHDFFIAEYAPTVNDAQILLHALNANVLLDYEAVCLLAFGLGRSNGDKFLKFCRNAINDPDVGVLAETFTPAKDVVTPSIKKFLGIVLPRLGEIKVELDFMVPQGSQLYINAMILQHVAALNLSELDMRGDQSIAYSDWFTKFLVLLGYFAKDGDYAMKTSVIPVKSTRQEGPSIKTIAFLLPQFHPVQENDMWWGKGFTEWNNVVRGRPSFRHHNQPRLPKDLGFYDLRHPDTQRRQAELAKANGVHGFCYYYYWFNGKKMLNEPIEQMLGSGNPDHPFCVCWANENWSRNWDGQERFVLLQQKYTLESNRALIREFITMMRDSRYIRHEGKPVVVIYRIRVIPNWMETAEMWRQECRNAGIGEIHLCAVRFGLEPLDGPPEQFNVDSYVLFPPHETRRQDVRKNLHDLHPRFNGEVFDYDSVVEGDLERFDKTYPWKVHRGAMMGWDNTARRQFDSRIFHGATPLKFRRWLKGILRQEQRNNKEASEALLFVNAWNEWAEGTTLEPDQRFGDGYLRAVRSTVGMFAPKFDTRAPKAKPAASTSTVALHVSQKPIALTGSLSQPSVQYRGEIALKSGRPTILLCAHISGHQLFGGERSFLDIINALEQMDYNVIVCLPSSNNAEYVRIIKQRVHCLYVFKYAQWHSRREIDQQVVLNFSDIIAEHDVSLVYANTIVLLEPLVAAERMGRLRLIHSREIISLDAPLQERLAMTAEEIIGEVFKRSDFLIANSNATLNLFARHDRTFHVPNAVDVSSFSKLNKIGKKVRFGLVSSNIPKKGMADFVQVAAICRSRTDLAEFVIIGPDNAHIENLRNDPSTPSNVKFVGYKDSPQEAMKEIDVLLSLSNFAESFGRTVAEAMASHKPVIAYEWGAVPELITNGTEGLLVPYRDVNAAADAVLKLCSDVPLITKMGNVGRISVEKKFSHKLLQIKLESALDAVFDKQRNVRLGIKSDFVSTEVPANLTIIVPVYNAYNEVKECIDAVLKYSDMTRFKLLIINDGSPDDRIKGLLDQYRAESNVEVLHNEVNIGYTRTINRGIRYAENDDIILLNSDAVVTPNWIAGLRAAAFQKENIATVTAMSDNAGAFSFPNFNEKNAIPSNLTRDEFARRVVQAASHCLPVEVPTGSGFCLYIRRSAIEKIGLFDEEAFARGYGEENDFCMRAREKGLVNLISPWAFVYHVRTASFQSEKEVLVKAGVDIVTKRYPKYASLVGEAFKSEAMMKLREATKTAYD